MKASDLVRPHIGAMEAYAPVFPLEVLAARLGRTVDSIIKLDANENPYGSPPQVREALAELPYPHIYPDPESRALRSALAQFTGLPADLILAGAGADELIDLITRLFLLPGDAILNCPPTFGMYAFDAAITGARVVSVRRTPDFSLDLDAMEKAAAQHHPKLLFVASPNNPDGSLVSDADLRRMLSLPLVVVLDEAYVDFAGPRLSRIRWVPEYENLIVLRTFSKWAGLAGLRVGYGVFPTSLLPDLWKIKQPYNVSVAASSAAIAAIKSQEWLQKTVASIVAERDRLIQALDAIPYLHPYPSLANFVLCKVSGKSAPRLKSALEQEGIMIRYFDKPGLRDHIRISVGTPEQMDALISILRRL